MKWPWQVHTPPLAEPELSPALKRRLDELEETNRRLAANLVLQEKGLKALELDWQEWFDKFRLMYARLSKRIKDAAEATPETHQDAPGDTNGQREHLRGRIDQFAHDRAALGPRRNY